MRRTNKYRNTKIKTNDGIFDSKKEYKRFIELKELEEIGAIHDLQRQVAFELIPSQRIDGKCVERPCKYVADFVYRVGDKTIVEDTKGVKTDVYVVKRKLMLYMHGIKIVEV